MKERKRDAPFMSMSVCSVYILGLSLGPCESPPLKPYALKCVLYDERVGICGPKECTEKS